MADILIVEDSLDILEVMQITLQMNGHVVRPVTTRQILDEELQGKIPDIIFLDVRFGFYDDGREICREIKGNEKTKDIPVILMSAAPERLQNFAECHADGILAKPFNLSDLISKLESFALHPTAPTYI